MEIDTTELRATAALGEQLSRFLNSESIQEALALTRAGIYKRWTDSETVTEREEAHAEHKALDRLLGAFHEIQNSGVLARETLAGLGDE